MATFNDLRCTQDSAVEPLCGPFTCYVANFQSLLPTPRKFTYKGCSTKKPNGFLCAKSIELGSDLCGHKASLTGKFQNFYRFQLLLFDANNVNPPMYATVFHCAEKLLELSPDLFAELSDAQQEAMLARITFDAPIVNAWFKPSRVTSMGHSMPILQKMDKVVVLDDPEENTGFHTPVKDLGKFHSPSSLRGSSSTTCKVDTAARPSNLPLSEAEAIALRTSLEHSLSLLSLHIPTPNKKQ